MRHVRDLWDWDDERIQHEKDAFIAEYARHGVATAARRARDLGPSVIAYWRETDEQFAFAYRAAREDSAENLEREAFRRGVEGWEEPVFYKGVEVGSIRKYSDALLILLLKARRPEWFASRSGSLPRGVSLDNGQPLSIKAIRQAIGMIPEDKD